MPRWARFAAAAAMGAAAALCALTLAGAVAASDSNRFWSGLWDLMATAGFLRLVAEVFLVCGLALGIALVAGPGRQPALAAAVWSGLLAALYGAFQVARLGGQWAVSAGLPVPGFWVLYWRHSAEVAALATAAVLGGAVSGAMLALLSSGRD